MKKAIVLVLCCVAFYLQACGSCAQSCKDFRANVVGGLDRRVVLYNASGQPIKEWAGKIYLADESGANTRFILDGKVVVINGTYIVEEK